MIKTNGYYLSNPAFYEDYVGGNKIQGYCHNAYKFDDDGTFRIGAIYNDELNVKFKKTDFDAEQINKFTVEKKILKLTFNFDKIYSHKIELIIKNSEILNEKGNIFKFREFK